MEMKNSIYNSTANVFVKHVKKSKIEKRAVIRKLNFNEKKNLLNILFQISRGVQFMIFFIFFFEEWNFFATYFI